MKVLSSTTGATPCIDLDPRVERFHGALLALEVLHVDAIEKHSAPVMPALGVADA